MKICNVVTTYVLSIILLLSGSGTVICEATSRENISKRNKITVVHSTLPKIKPQTPDEILRSHKKYFRQKDGDKWLKGIWHVESDTAHPTEIVVGDGGTSFGHFQVKVGTVRTIEKEYGLNLKMTDKQIKEKLKNDFNFGAEMAARYLGYLERHFNYKWPIAVEAYNTGPNKVRKSLPYYKKVKEKVANLS